MDNRYGTPRGFNPTTGDSDDDDWPVDGIDDENDYDYEDEELDVDDDDEI